MCRPEPPAKTVEFSDKLDAVRVEMLTTLKTSDTVRSLKKGIMIFDFIEFYLR